MEDEQRALIDDVLSNQEVGDDVLLRFERLGDTAFDEICRRLMSQSLSPSQQVLALRRLVRLMRQFCAMRKEELLELAVERLKSDDPFVRSGAVNTAIWTAIMLQENPSLASKAENRPGANPSLRERVKAAVGHAVRLGVDEEQAEFAREYLAH
jgi:hypothetical protein